MLDRKETSSECLTLRVQPSLKDRISQVAALYESIGYSKSDIARIALEKGLFILEQEYKNEILFQRMLKIKPK